MDYVLTTNCLDKRYRNFQALNGLTMHVPKGAIYGFVGKNGAGKTTLLRLVCGLQEPTSGSFTLYGIRNDESETPHRSSGGDSVNLSGYDSWG